MTEEQIQSTVAIWFWNTFPDYRRMLFHVDNNSYNSIIGAKKKSMGVCSGPSDMILILSLGKTVFLEFKTESGSQSNEQKDFEQKVKSRGHEYKILRSVEQAKNFILQKLTQDGE